MWDPLGDTAGPGGGPQRKLQTRRQNPVTETLPLLLCSPPACAGWVLRTAGSVAWQEAFGHSLISRNMGKVWVHS